MIRITTVIIVLLVVCTARAAAPMTDEQRIEALVREAQAQRREGRFDEAAATLNEAINLRAEPFLFYSLARVYEDSGQTAVARRYYELCVKPEVDEATRRRATEALARLDAPAETPAAPLIAEPGPEPVAVVDVPPRSVATFAPQGTDLGAWPWVVGGAALVAGGLGAYLFIDGTEDWSDAAHRQVRGEPDAAAANALVAGGTDKRHAGIALGIGGGALLVTSVIMFLVDDDAAPSASVSFDGDALHLSIGGGI